MKKHWLRGVLLGVSVALLLSGGVALARGLFMTVDKACVECWPGEGWPTEDKYLLGFTSGGWDTRYDLCEGLTIDGQELWPEYCDDPPPEDPVSGMEYFPCEWPDSTVRASVLRGGVSTANGPPVPDPLGEWRARIWQVETGDSAEASWLVAEDCAAAMFVPEPGTVMLLGSGLAGLAGYATLRWRSRD